MILYTEEGIYEVVPPMIFEIPARIIMLSLLLLDSVGLLVFWINSEKHVAWVLAFLIIVNVIFFVGHLKDSFLAIFWHLMKNVAYLILLLVIFIYVEYDKHVCREKRCQKVSEMFNGYGMTINMTWFYTFCIFTTLVHLMILELTWMLMKYTAAKSEIRKLSNQMERRRQVETLNMI